MADGDYAEPPVWVTKDFIQKVLKTHHGDEDLTITDFSIGGASAKGDNYSSIMSRASCTVNSRGKIIKKMLIIKTMPVGEIAIRYVTDTKSFQTETKMLADILPSVEKILKSAGHDEELAPRVIHAAIEPQPVIIMEDLCDTKFTVGDRILGLNLEQSLAVIKSLAALHAGTVALVAKCPELKDDFKGGIWSAENAQNNERLIIDGVRAVVKYVDVWSGEKWSDKIKPLLEKVPKILYDVYDSEDQGKVSVINHGDLWTNNVMLRYRGCGMFDVRFIDLQLSTYRSPVFDLMYFIFTSPRREVRFQYLDTLLKAYHDKFTEFIKRLDLSLDYTFEDMMKDFRDKLFFGFFSFYGIRAVVTAPKSDAVDVSTEITDMTESGIFQNKHFQDCLVDGLPYFHKNGLF